MTTQTVYQTGEEFANKIGKNFHSLSRQYRRWKEVQNVELPPLSKTSSPSKEVVTFIMEKISDDMPNASEQFDTKNYEFQKVKDELLTLTKEKNELTQKVQRLSQIEQELLVANAKIKELENTNDEIAQQTKAILDTKNNLDNKLYQMDNQIQKVEIEKKEFQNQIQQLETVNEDNKKLIQKQSEQLNALKIQKQQLVKELENTKTDNQRYWNRQAETKRYISQIEQELNEIKQLYEVLAIDYQNITNSFKFKLKTFLAKPIELDVINILSCIMAFYGFITAFGAMAGTGIAVTLVAHYINVMRNARNKNNSEAFEYALMTAVVIEMIFGVFHYSTFATILKNSSAEILFSQEWTAIGLATIMSSAAIRAILQMSKQ